MAERIPHLTALRAFEAAARHLSFQDAASELGLSPSAVSHQIRTLEEYLKVQLFERVTRGVLLTQAGQALYPGLNEGFGLISNAVRTTRSLNAHSVISISGGPSITAKFLAPNLYQFEELWPSITVQISTSNEVVDLNQKDIDLALRYGKGEYPGFDTIRLFGESHTPMCSPDFFNSLKKNRLQPEDIVQLPLLNDNASQLAGEAPDWSEWFAQQNIEADIKGRNFRQTDHAIQAAIDGAGILFGRVSIAAGDIAAGRLVLPFSARISSQYSYYLVAQKGRIRERPIAAFVKWLQALATEFNLS